MTTEAVQQHTHAWEVVKEACSHAVEQGRIGQACVCACGRVGHRWADGFFCARLSGTRKREAIEAEHAACPIWERIVRQRSVGR